MFVPLELDSRLFVVVLRVSWPRFFGSVVQVHLVVSTLAIRFHQGERCLSSSITQVQLRDVQLKE